MNPDLTDWLLLTLISATLTLLYLLFKQRHAGQVISSLSLNKTTPEPSEYPAVFGVGETLYNKHLFRMIYDKAPLGIGVAAPDGRVVMVNPVFTRILGYREEDIVGRLFTELTYSEDIADTLQELQRIQSGAEDSYQMEKRYRHRDGHIIWVQVNAVMVRTANGEPWCIIAQVLDISAHKQAMQQLSRWENIFSCTGVGMVVSYNGRTLDLVNPSYAAMHGYRQEELSGQSTELVVEPRELQKVARMIRQADTSGHCIYESVDRRKDGSTFPVLVDITVVYRDDGSVHYRIASIHDISEHKKAEDIIRSSEARLHEAERLAHLGSWEWQIATGEQIWSQETFRIFGIDPGHEQAGYECFMSLLDASDQLKLKTAAEKSINEGVPYHVEFRVNRPDGGVREVVSQARLYTGPDGRVHKMVGTNLDVTESRRAQRRLWESQMRLHALMSNIPGVVFQATTTDGGQTFAFIYLNDRAEQLFGIRAEVYLDDISRLTDSIAAADREAFEQSRLRSAAGKKVWDWEGRIVLASGEEKWINLRAMPRNDNDRLIWDGVMLNITNNKRAENDLYLSRQLLRELASEMETVRENERKHIAREVHDELGQLLTALRMDVALLAMRFPGLPADFYQRIGDMKGLVDQAIHAVRTVASDLRPAALDMGLQDALEWQLAEFSRRTGIQTRLRGFAGSSDLEEQRAVAVFRIIQESLTNISRYAQASRVDISVSETDGLLQISVRDDGIGFNPHRKHKEKKSYGLLGMQERVLALGGKLLISSAEGRGTDILLTVPLNSNRVTELYDPGVNSR